MRLIIRLLPAVSMLFPLLLHAQEKPDPTAPKTARELGLEIGVMATGKWNAITDVTGVKVGHHTLVQGDSVRTGVTVILPHSGNLFQEKVPAAIFVGNGFGKLAGSTQVMELGNLETPIALTNTLSVPVAMQALVNYTLRQTGNESVQSVNALVGETNDGWLNDIRGMHLKEEHVFKAIAAADSGKVAQGNVGAGTGTVCFNFKGGIGTSSRALPSSLGGYTVGVLVQTNFGGVLQVDGIPVGEIWNQFSFSNHLQNRVDGSCMIVVATDAPIDASNLERLAKRAFMGLAKTGGIASNGSGDYVIAFSTYKGNRISHISDNPVQVIQNLSNEGMSPLFMAAIEATEEAILNSLFMAVTVKGYKGRTISAIPLPKMQQLLKTYHKIPK
ncbi:P1 family peptidase [Flavihumibacter cheonanensis]|uniref:DmpA family aminopeptidase n=1 Tax=Flavihumibacter cheonanensis TaxID=1442385 RepID=UPI001EF8832B|nr:P1 family peptidase [Flavihumibacter cheonanensis]MCG7751244.1 P1 family peptidase [Flavihumibacter cheonanensis]